MGVVQAMNGMTIYDIRKPDTIKKAAEKYGVTQISIKNVLNKMGVKSNRARKAQKEFGYYHNRGLYQHKKKIEEE